MLKVSRKLYRTLTCIIVIVFLAALVIKANPSFNFTLLLAYIEALKWPAIVLIVLAIIRPYLASLFDRLSEFGYRGAKFKLRPGQKVPRSIEAEDIISKIKTATPKEAKQLKRNEAIDTYFEEIYNQLYVTQLSALQRLNEFKDLPPDAFEDLLAVHRNLARGLPGAYNSTSQLMSLFTSTSLITFHEERHLDNPDYEDIPRGGVFRIQYAGESFLSYLHDRRVYKAPIEL